MTPKAGAPQAKHSGKVDRARRKLVKLIAAGGAGAIASPWMFQSSRAAAQDHQDRHDHAGDRPDRRVRRAVEVGGRGRRARRWATASWSPARSIRSQILNRDSQSNPNRASEVAAQLINNDKVDIMIASSTSDTTNPVADQCELAGVPCVTSDDPWQAWFFGRKGDPKKGFEWTYHFFWGFDMVANMFAEMWLTLPTNKIVGVMLTNDPDGVAASDPVHGLPATIKSHGFDVHFLGLYPPLSDDFSSQIAELKKANCDIACGIFNPPQFAIFWTQCAQQGYRPKIVTPPKALLVPDRRRGAGRPRRRHVDRSVVVAPSPVQVGPHRRDGAAVLRRLREGERQAMDPAARLQARQSRSRDRCAQAREEARSRAPSATPSRRPTTSRSSARSPGRAGRPIRCRTCAPRRWSADSGRRARSSSTT